MLHAYVKQTFDKFPQCSNGNFGKSQREWMNWFIYYMPKSFFDNNFLFQQCRFHEIILANNYHALHIYCCYDKEYVKFCVTKPLQRKLRVAMIYDTLQIEYLGYPYPFADEYIVKTIVTFL